MKKGGLRTIKEQEKHKNIRNDNKNEQIEKLKSKQII